MKAEDLEVTAVYDDLYDVTVTDGTGSGSYAAGDKVTIKAEEKEGKEFTQWNVVKGDVTLQKAESAETSFTMPEGAVELAAIYKDKATEGGSSGDVTTPGDTTNPGDTTTPGDTTNPGDTTTPGDTTNPSGTTTSGGTTSTGDKTTSGGTTSTGDKTTSGGTTSAGDKTTSGNTTTSGGTTTSGAGSQNVNAPAKVNTKLSVSASKCEVKVVSADAENPTVTYVKSTDTKAKSITIPDTVKVDKVTYKVVSVADNAMQKNKKVTTITLGKNVTSIGKNAFKGCTSLKTVNIKSSSFTKIGANAFSGDKKLTTVKMVTTKLTSKSIGKNAFKGTNKKLTIKVPKKKVSSYKKYFKNKGNKTLKVKKG
jgi:hypothetical protein